MPAIAQTSADAGLVYMSVKQVANYLNLNEKKIYALVSDNRIPATKITGKWMFPRELIDKWMLDSSHGGLLTDRLIVDCGQRISGQRYQVNGLAIAIQA